MAKRDGLSTSKHVCHHPYRKQRQESAAKLAAERASRSDKQQLEALDRRLGPGQGAQKERARLQARIEAASTKKPETAKKKKE